MWARATITAISDHGDRAACEVTVTRKGEEAEAQKPTLSETSLELVQQYDALHPTQQLTLTNSDHSFIYVYQWRSSDPNIASVDDKGVVTARSRAAPPSRLLLPTGRRCGAPSRSHPRSERSH